MMKKFVLSVLVFSLVEIGSTFGQTAPVPDTNFLNFLKTYYPSTIDASDELIISQAASLTGTLDLSNLDITNLEGIQYFTGLTKLDVDDNQLTDVSQISNLSALEDLRLENNLLTSLPSLSNLTNLEKLIAFDNQLTSLPDLSNNTQLIQIVVYNNQLTALPDLSALTNLEKLDAGNNQISVTPDVSANTALTDLMIDRNLLTTAPDLTNLNNLDQLQLHLNHFTFEDLLPYTSHPDYALFELFPQKPIALSNISVLTSGNLLLTTGTDHSTPGVTYNWYLNAVLVGSVTNDSVIISNPGSANEGSYSGILAHPSFPGYQLTTSAIAVDVIDCPTVGDFSFEYGRIDCIDGGSLKVNVSSVPPQTYTFRLISPVTGDTLTSLTGLFEKLNKPKYTLQLEAGPCLVTYPDPILIPYDKCREVILTPDGDGENDKHFFTNTGTVTIYNKNGNVVKTLSLPGEWDGSGMNGSLVAPGYYYAEIDNGKEFLNITVIY